MSIETFETFERNKAFNLIEFHIPFWKCTFYIVSNNTKLKQWDVYVLNDALRYQKKNEEEKTMKTKIIGITKQKCYQNVVNDLKELNTQYPAWLFAVCSMQV